MFTLRRQTLPAPMGTRPVSAGPGWEASAGAGGLAGAGGFEAEGYDGIGVSLFAASANSTSPCRDDCTKVGHQPRRVLLGERYAYGNNLFMHTLAQVPAPGHKSMTPIKLCVQEMAVIL